mmetsp:Transcript_1965/g.5175  ORF Transcript_1965/g.5175 Transcript_1965/m.5175 type:complete len:311 (-) Transcript_1965:608-1540(-)
MMDVEREFLDGLKRGEKIAPSAVRVLSEVVKRSGADTVMQLERDLHAASEVMRRSVGASSISLQAVSEMFLAYLTRESLDSHSSFEQCKRELIARGERFVSTTQMCVDKITDAGSKFVADGCTLMTHGDSKVVSAILVRAASVEQKKFHVYVTETRPLGEGYKVAARLQRSGIPVTVVLDAALGAVMERVDVVLVGAEGIVENGGVVNRIGTLLLAMAAKAFNKPFYVACESYKFTRMYPLSQKELPSVPGIDAHAPWQPQLPGVEAPEGVNFENIVSDFTPASYITLLFSDVGVLTPAAVSDELIQLYR